MKANNCTKIRKVKYEKGWTQIGTWSVKQQIEWHYKKGRFTIVEKNCEKKQGNDKTQIEIFIIKIEIEWHYTSGRFKIVERDRKEKKENIKTKKWKFSVREIPGSDMKVIQHGYNSPESQKKPISKFGDIVIERRNSIDIGKRLSIILENEENDNIQ